MKKMFLSVIVGLMVIAGCEKQEALKIETEMIYEVAGMELGCPVESVNGPEKSVIGEWVVVKEITGILEPEPTINDYSCDTYKYLYRFRPDGTLIAGAASPYGIPGMYTYEFRLSPLNKIAEEPYTLIVRDEIEYACDIQRKGRILKLNGNYINNTYTTKNIRYFVRIK